MSEMLQDVQNQEPTVVETTQGTPESTPPESSVPPPAEGAEAAAPAAYTPNFKYKFDKEEREIDEWARAGIKDAETEKKAKELFERASAFDRYKARNEEMTQTISTKYEPLAQAFINVAQAYKAKDFDSVFSQLKIDEKDIYKWVAEKIRFQELPEEEKARYNEELNTRARAASLERENQLLSERQRSYEVQARSFELDQSLAGQEVKSAADAFDAIYGAGAFKAEVVKTGQYHSLMNGKDLSVAEAIAETISKAKPLVARLGQGGQASQPQTQAPAKLPVIPNPQGGASSAAKPVVKSLDDLKRIADAM